jgi:membrane protein YqaA with SNARE-associated domain
MRALLSAFLRHFLTPPGLVILGALDASLIFFLPLGIDFAVIILSARTPTLFWLHALLATAGSALGAAATFWIGRKIGEHGLTHLISPSRLRRVRNHVTERAAIGVGALAVIPPPFPFTAFVLTSGAIGANSWTFFVAVATARLVRFGLEGALAAIYGRQILRWMESPTFEVAVGVLIVMALIGTILSGVAVVRSTRRRVN